MGEFAVAIFILGVIGLFAFIFGVVLPWDVHRTMVKNSTNSYGEAGYDKFLEEFHKVDWVNDSTFSESLFSRDHNDKIHASIIMFNGKGMMMKNPVAHFRVERYVKRYIKENFGARYSVTEWRE